MSTIILADPSLRQESFIHMYFAIHEDIASCINRKYFAKREGWDGIFKSRNVKELTLSELVRASNDSLQVCASKMKIGWGSGVSPVSADSRSAGRVMRYGQ